jgi:serine/threonine-protein kinase
VDPAPGDALPEEPRTASLKAQDSTPIATPEIGTVLGGKYLLEERIGSGGMGIVFAAKHLKLCERVALKFVAATSSAAMTRLLREARLAAAIKSDHVARVLDVGTTDGGVPYIVMEYLEGESLAKRLRAGGALTTEETLAIGQEICAGLAAAHAKGIVHRDLKPSNVFVSRTADGRRVVKVVDFGVAKELTPDDGGDGEGTLTGSTTVLGSPFYMAPEQVRSAKDVDARADVWSLGATLYEMLAGKPPFVAETTPGVLAAVVADRPRSLREARPEIPRGLEDVVLRCLEKDREARWQDVAAVAAALADVASGKTSIMPVAAPRPRAKMKWTPVVAIVAVAISGIIGVRSFSSASARAPAPENRAPSPIAVSATVATATASETATPTATETATATASAHPTAIAPRPPIRVVPPARSAASAPRPDVSAATADRH